MNPTEIILALIYATIIATNLVLRSQRNQARQDLAAAREERDVQTKLRLAADERVEVTDRQMVELVEAVTPLIEKSDWMTGRWHGQFNTLVSMENQRNDRVEAARRALWKIPVVADATRTVPLLPSLNLLGKTVEDRSVAEAAAEVGRISSGLADRLANTTTEKDA